MNLPFDTILIEFAKWIGTPAAFALILERIPKFQNWKSPLKFWVVIALFVGLPYFSQFAVYAIGVVNPALLAQVQNFINLALVGLSFWSVSQLTHANDYVNDKEQ